MSVKINPLTGQFDFTGGGSDPNAIKKDGTTTTTAQIPFAVGIQSSDDVVITAGKKLVLDGA